jgi:hypothetical protein
MDASSLAPGLKRCAWRADLRRPGLQGVAAPAANRPVTRKSSAGPGFALDGKKTPVTDPKTRASRHKPVINQQKAGVSAIHAEFPPSGSMTPKRDAGFSDEIMLGR